VVFFSYIKGAVVKCFTDVICSSTFLGHNNCNPIILLLRVNWSVNIKVSKFKSMLHRPAYWGKVKVKKHNKAVTRVRGQ
jgi:hypothetical protein